MNSYGPESGFILVKEKDAVLTAFRQFVCGRGPTVDNLDWVIATKPDDVKHFQSGGYELLARVWKDRRSNFEGVPDHLLNAASVIAEIILLKWAIQFMVHAVESGTPQSEQVSKTIN